MKPTTDEVLAWAREAGFEVYEEDKFCNAHITDTLVHIDTAAEALATLAYAAGAAAMKERAAKVCHDKAWELKSRAMKETGRVQRTRLNSEAIGWHDAHGAIRALGDDDD